MPGGGIKAGAVCYHLNCAPQTIAAVLCATRPEHCLYLSSLARFHDRQILIRPGPKGGVIESHAIDQIQDLVAGQTPQERRDLSGPGLLQQNIRTRLQRVCHGGAGARVSGEDQFRSHHDVLCYAGCRRDGDLCGDTDRLQGDSHFRSRHHQG